MFDISFADLIANLAFLWSSGMATMPEDRKKAADTTDNGRTRLPRERLAESCSSSSRSLARSCGPPSSSFSSVHGAEEMKGIKVFPPPPFVSFIFFLLVGGNAESFCLFTSSDIYGLLRFLG